MTRLLLIIFTVVSVTCFSQTTINKEYKTADKEISITIVPYFDKIDDILFSTFISDKFTVVDTSAISYNILNHEQFNNTLRKVIEEYATAKISKPYKNIYEKLTENEINDFKAKTLNSDFIIIPSKIDSRTVTKINRTGFIHLHGGITIYDLHSGQFVLQCNEKIRQDFTDANPDVDAAVRKLIETYIPYFLEVLK
jgi:hypothetical protein